MTNETNKSPSENVISYNPILCSERMGRLKSDIDNGLNAVRNDVAVCQREMIQKIAAERDLAAAKSEGNQKAVSEALSRIAKALEENEDRIEELEDQMPTDAINRMVSLEGWRKYIIGGFSAFSLFAYLLWLHVSHVTTEHSAIVQAAQKILTEGVKR